MIFPHHENEIAQSEAVSGNPLTKYWIHHGFVNINHEKMSKSLNNILRVKDVLKQYHPDAIRYFLLSSHYRSPIDYNEQALLDASGNIDRFYKVLGRIMHSDIPCLNNATSKTSNTASEPFWQRFSEAMDDDFNTAKAIAILHDSVRELNKLLDNNDFDNVSTVLSQLYKMRDVLGILLEPPEVYDATIKALKSSTRNIDTDEIEKLINDRSEARQSKDWEKADRIRQQLEDMNVVLEDNKDGTIWRIEN